MNVLIITGDRHFRPGHPRFEIQKGAVERLEILYWGRGSMWPSVPQVPFDVVSSQDPFLRGLFAWRVARTLRAKFNVQVHADLNGQSFLKRALARIVLKHADSIRVVSEKIKKQLWDMGIRAGVTVLPVFIDIESFSTIERKPHAGKNILWVGRFEPEKDPMAAISVFKDVFASHPDARLTMLGAGSLETQLKHAAKELPVEFPGWQDPKPYLAQADAMLSTSPYESFGASMVEALAAGIPVVSLDVGIAKEAGATVVPRNRLAQAVVEVLRSSARGTLTLTLLSRDAWARAWRDSL